MQKPTHGMVKVCLHGFSPGEVDAVLSILNRTNLPDLVNSINELQKAYVANADEITGGAQTGLYHLMALNTVLTGIVIKR